MSSGLARQSIARDADTAQAKGAGLRVPLLDRLPLYALRPVSVGHFGGRGAGCLLPIRRGLVRCSALAEVNDAPAFCFGGFSDSPLRGVGCFCWPWRLPLGMIEPGAKTDTELLCRAAEGKSKPGAATHRGIAMYWRRRDSPALM